MQKSSPASSFAAAANYAAKAPAEHSAPALIGSAALALWQLNHPDWMHAPQRGGLITRRFLFKDFKQAFAFMTQVAMYAEQHNHHPEWSNSFNRVDITLTTHDAGGITQLDLDLAAYADSAHQRVVHH